jgi:hypothetical protein
LCFFGFLDSLLRLVRSLRLVQLAWFISFVGLVLCVAAWPSSFLPVGGRRLSLGSSGGGLRSGGRMDDDDLETPLELDLAARFDAC